MARRLEREARKLQTQWSRDPHAPCDNVWPPSRLDVTPTRCLAPRAHLASGTDHRHSCAGLNITWPVVTADG